MSLKLDLLLEAINELDNMEANGEVLEESFSSARKQIKAEKNDFKDIKKDDKFKLFKSGKMEKDEAKKYYDDTLKLLNDLDNKLLNADKSKVLDVLNAYKNVWIKAIPVIGVEMVYSICAGLGVIKAVSAGVDPDSVLNFTAVSTKGAIFIGSGIKRINEVKEAIKAFNPNNNYSADQVRSKIAQFKIKFTNIYTKNYKG